MNTALLTIKFTLQHKAEWRRKISAVYPDPRNLLAADVLEQLAAEVDKSEHLDLADKLTDIKAIELNQAASETAHKVAYWHHPRDLGEFVDLVVEKAVRIRQEHEAVFPSKKGSAPR